MVVIDFRLTFAWSGSPSFWGVMSAAAEHAHCNTNLETVQIMSEGEHMMAHVKKVDRWEEGTPTSIPADANIRAHGGGGKLDLSSHNSVRGRLPINKDTTLRRRHVSPNCLGLDRFRSYVCSGRGRPELRQLLHPKRA